MADKKDAIYIDFSKYPDLYKEIMTLVEKNESTPPRIARMLIRDGLGAREQSPKEQKSKQVTK